MPDLMICLSIPVKLRSIDFRWTPVVPVLKGCKRNAQYEMGIFQFDVSDILTLTKWINPWSFKWLKERRISVENGDIERCWPVSK